MKAMPAGFEPTSDVDRLCGFNRLPQATIWVYIHVRSAISVTVNMHTNHDRLLMLLTTYT